MPHRLVLLITLDSPGPSAEAGGSVRAHSLPAGWASRCLCGALLQPFAVHIVLAVLTVLAFFVFYISHF